MLRCCQLIQQQLLIEVLCCLELLDYIFYEKACQKNVPLPSVFCNTVVHMEVLILTIIQLQEAQLHSLGLGMVQTSLYVSSKYVQDHRTTRSPW